MKIFSRNHSLFIFYERRSYIKKLKIQDWLPYDDISNDGIIISKNRFVKILKITPITYELKSDLEKESILESYKLFLRTCNFDIQILIQSKKEDILNFTKHIEFENDENIDLVKKEYISYIKDLNSNNKLSSKKFFILISVSRENNQNDIRFIENTFSEMTLKIKDTLSKCGNDILEIVERKEVIQIINTFLNPYED